MASERKRIRDAIKAAIETEYSGEVIASRVYDARNKRDFVTVYFESGDIEWDGIKNFTTASIVVAYMAKDLSTDDELDEVADLVNGVLAVAPIAPDLIQGFIPAGFEYLSENESAYSGIALRYTVIY